MIRQGVFHASIRFKKGIRPAHRAHGDILRGPVADSPDRLQLFYLHFGGGALIQPDFTRIHGFRKGTDAGGSGGDYPQGPEALLNAISQIHNIFCRGKGAVEAFNICFNNRPQFPGHAAGECAGGFHRYLLAKYGPHRRLKRLKTPRNSASTYAQAGLYLIHHMQRFMNGIGLAAKIEQMPNAG